MVPPPVDIELPVLLGLPNTRLKDFYDLWYLSRTFPFEGELLCDALQATFTRRSTPFPRNGLPAALTAEFTDDPRKQSQWSAFVGKTRLSRPADTLPALIDALRAFLQPPLQALAHQKSFRWHWTAEGFWQD